MASLLLAVMLAACGSPGAADDAKAVAQRQVSPQSPGTVAVKGPQAAVASSRQLPPRMSNAEVVAQAARGRAGAQASQIQAEQQRRLMRSAFVKTWKADGTLKAASERPR